MYLVEAEMIDKVTIESCCLCGNCVDVCPVQAISYNNNYHTFHYPVINTEKCIHCGKCEEVCPAVNPLKQQAVIGSYAAKHNDKDILRASTSGGVFSAVAAYVIENGGIVYGATFTDNFKVKHIGVTSLDELSKLRGSKYVQSDLTGVFIDIKKQLADENNVLFTGCPCQCAALRAFLGNQAHGDKLIVMDFICHGILSYDLFAEYITYLENKRNSKIINFCFRDKTYGWADSGPRITYQNGKTDHWPLYEDMYMQGYFQHLCMKEACYKCKFKNCYSGSDITIGDFWGVDQLAPSIYDNKGISVVITQTKMGEEIVDIIGDFMTIYEQNIENLTKCNRGFFESFKKSNKSDYFYTLSSDIGYINALKKITNVGMYEKIKRKYRKLKREWLCKK